MVMCHNGKSMGHISNCLEELIGKDDAVAFANWYVELLLGALRIRCGWSIFWHLMQSFSKIVILYRADLHPYPMFYMLCRFRQLIQQYDPRAEPTNQESSDAEVPVPPPSSLYADNEEEEDNEVEENEEYQDQDEAVCRCAP